MKKNRLLCVLLLATLIAGAILAPSRVVGQGTLMFRNRFGTAINAPCILCDGTRASGPNWVAELMVGTTADNLMSATPPTPFLTGDGAGYVNGGMVTVPGIPGGASGFALVRAWDITSGATYASAYAKTQSAVFAVTLGGGGVPPGPPTDLTGLGTTPFPQMIGICPEPSTHLLLGLGAISFWLFRRNRRK